MLVFPTPTDTDRGDLGGGGGKVVVPSAAEQERRLKQKFLQISAGISALQPTVEGMEPEQVIVFVTVGDSIKKLSEAAARVPGLEWLAELDLDDYEPDATFREEDDPTASLSHRLYALMANRNAMRQLLSLWTTWISNPSKRAVPNFGPFKELFIHLSDVRRWGPEDRIDQTLLVENWRDSLAQSPDLPTRFEAELWFRGGRNLRVAAFNELSRLVASQGGRVLAQAAIESIIYHGVLIEMPSSSVADTLNRIDSGEFTDLLKCEGVMFFRPMGQARFPIETDTDSTHKSAQRDLSEQPSGPPRVALLDGMPVVRHSLLDGRILVDDPDEFGQRYEPRQQEHGTAMASLIVHGDLSEIASPLKSPVYVRPIFVPFDPGDGSFSERTPSATLLVDLVHRAIMRLSEQEITKDSVRVVNLSLGDAFRPFVRELSPLARLIDWLAWEYRLLINISAGNQLQPICLPCSGAEFAKLSDDDAVRTTLTAINGDQSARRHFSPAEAVNAVTVGAVHADSSTPPKGDRRIDLLRGKRLPSPLATVSRGFKRSIKPEILLPGGRLMYHDPAARSGDHWKFRPATGVKPPGIQVAAPGNLAMDFSRTTFCNGTSNSTALASRTSCRIIERLEEVLAETSGVEMDNSELSSLTKALLVHGAAWGPAQQIVERLLVDPSEDWRFRQAVNAKFLGFGEVDPERCLYCTDQRATLLGWGYLEKDTAHSYRFPLPPSLSAKRVLRRLTVTLAWLTPINPEHRDYRKAAMWFTVNKRTIGVERANLDQDSAKRGTVVHQIFEGDAGRAFPGDLEIKVNCREQASHLTERVPYGLAVTLEVGEGLSIPVYEEVRDRIRPRVGISPGSSASIR